MSNYQTPPWISASTDVMREQERAFIRSVYGWMFGGLLLTAFSSLWVVMSPALQQIVIGNGIARFVLFIAEIGIVFYLSAALRRMSAAAAAIAFLAFSVLNGLSLSIIFFAYTADSLVQAFVVAAGMFGAMAVFGLVTKRDLTSWGSFFFMGLIGIVLASLVNMFLHSEALGWITSVIGVFVFVGLTAYDNQRLKVFASNAGSLRDNYAVFGALQLYLDFVNLFLMLLRIFGGGRRR